MQTDTEEPTHRTRMHCASLLNRRAVKDLILARAATLRPNNDFCRVGGDSYAYLEGKVRATIDACIRSHPSLGKTLKFE